MTTTLGYVISIRIHQYAGGFFLTHSLLMFEMQLLVLLSYQQREEIKLLHSILSIIEQVVKF